MLSLLPSLPMVLAQTSPTSAPEGWGIWGLGVIAVALVIGAGLTYRWVVVPERTRGDAAQARADKAYELCLPLVERSTSTQDRLLSLLPAIEVALRAGGPEHK